MTFCPTYGLATRVVEYYQSKHPDYSINKNSIKKYWADAWLFTQYGFRVPSQNEELISIAFNSYRHLVFLTEGKLWDSDWFIKVEKPLLYLFDEEVSNAVNNLPEYEDFYKIECNDSALCVRKSDMKMVIDTLKLFSNNLNQQRKEKS